MFVLGTLLAVSAGACGGDSPTAPSATGGPPTGPAAPAAPAPASVQSIAVNTPRAELTVGDSAVLTAMATMSDGSTQPVTAGTWDSDNQNVITLTRGSSSRRAAVRSETVRALAVGPGAATVFIDWQGVRGTVLINVGLASIAGAYSGPTVFPSAGTSINFSPDLTETSTGPATSTLGGFAQVLIDSPGVILVVPFPMRGSRVGNDVTINFDSITGVRGAYTFTGTVEDNGATLRGTMEGPGTSSSTRLRTVAMVFTRQSSALMPSGRSSR